MSLESIDSQGFSLKPGGVQEEGLATDLAVNEYSQSSGITNVGGLIRMPGKRFVRRFPERVLQIAGFGGAVLIQHGSTVEMFPDACAVSPTDDDDGRERQVVTVPIMGNVSYIKGDGAAYPPWSAHPSTYRFNPPTPFSADHSTPQIFYRDFALDAAVYGVVNANVGGNLKRHYIVKGLNQTRQGDDGIWYRDYGCEVHDQRWTASIDLRAYSKAMYSGAGLGGNYNSYAKDSLEMTTDTNNWSMDLSDHLGELITGFVIPLPKYGVLLQTYVGNEAGATKWGLFDVEATHLTLIKKTPTGNG